MRHLARWLCVLGCLALLAMSGPATAVAFAASARATDVFVGTATSGVGQPTPMVIDPSDVTVRGDGAIGLGYRYTASGDALGSLPGRFSYTERGYVYFQPPNLTTPVGSALTSAVFTLYPRDRAAPLQIVDTDPAAYTWGIATTPRSSLPPAAGRALRDLARLGLGPVRNGDQVTYGYFTFTNQSGTTTGYATPDFRAFAIPVTFDLPTPLNRS